MTPCPTCGRELGPNARFCGSCGTPVAQHQQQQPFPQQQPLYQPPPEPQTIPQPLPYTPQAPPPARHSAPRSVLLPATAGAAVVALLATGVVVFVLPHFNNQAQSAPPPVSVSASPTTTTTTTTVPTTTTTTEPTTTTPTPPTAADLAAQVAGDHVTAETLVGQWVPQISSKRLGLVVNGVTFGYPEIMADFQSLHTRFPEAILVYSNDYANFSGKDFWVTLDATSFATADQANAWCDQQGFAQQDCYASRLTHTGGPAGNSKTR